MFSNGFFPTPREVVYEMLAPYVWEHHGRCYLKGSRDWFILEPSAGKGDIVDVLVDDFGLKRERITCIELDPDLVYILQKKGYRVIDYNFLEHEGRYDYDLILMNPPFAEGVQHLLKAWEVMRNGDIVCLLNMETIRNPHTKKRELLARIIANNGTIENLGQCFKGAERPTDVEVALVRLHKETPLIELDFGGGYDRDEFVVDEEFIANPLAKANIVEALVDQHNAARELTVQIHELKKARAFYLDVVRKESYADVTKQVESKSLNEVLVELNDVFWKYVFTKTAVGREMTSEAEAKMDEFRLNSGNLSFTVNNIMRAFDVFRQNRTNLMESCLQSVFDQITSYHDDNVIHHEGWKTNKSWKVAKKIIWPHGCRYDNDHFQLYYRDTFLDDLDKALCYIRGIKFEEILSTRACLDKRFSELGWYLSSEDYRPPIYSSHFEIRFFKKGTVHLRFLDDDLWQDFNMAVAKGRNWVGAGY